MPAAEPTPGAATDPLRGYPAAPASPGAATRSANTRSALDTSLATLVLALAAFLASFAVAAAAPVSNSDLWLHLAAGRLVAAGQFPFGPDPFTAVDGATWVNHAWLFDLLLYLLYQSAGGAALVVAKAVLVVALAAVLLVLRRPGAGGLGPAAATTLALLAASPLLVVRSAVASYLLFAVLLLILRHRFGPAGRWQLPLAVGVLFLLWVNTDGGFVLGLLLLVIWVVGAALERLAPMGEAADPADEPPHPPAVLAAALAAAVVASLVNPYHVRAFHLPAELAALTLPAEVRREPYFESTFRSPFTAAHVDQVGAVAAGAFYLLLAVGLASFAVNAGGWRWRRALAWAAFAWLGASYWRLVPYFAVVGGPVAVLNVQAYLARRRAAGAEAPNVRAERLRTFAGLAARAGLLVVVAALLALAWPGWLGPDARSAAPSRRVAWRADPDPTMERLARRLADWYAAGQLRPGEARGFHYQPDFNYYCAWFCPAEKGTFDARLTVPPAAAADYFALRRAVSGLAAPPGPDHPGPPDPLLRAGGYTHLVVTGPAVLAPPPTVNGLGLVLFKAPERWPAWAIDGAGVVCGWRDPAKPGPDPHAELRLDPIRRAVGDRAEQLPKAPAEFPRPTQPTLWDRYRTAPAPVPADASEAGLWLAYREATAERGGVMVALAQEVSRVARYAPTARGEALVNLTELFNQSPEALKWQRDVLSNVWGRSAEGRAGRAALLLAVRAARRATRANPDDPTAYERLAVAYGNLDADPLLGLTEQITAVRQALARLPAARRRPAPSEEFVLYQHLLRLYQTSVIPGTNQQPRDLMLECMDKYADLIARLGPAAMTGVTDAKQVEAEINRLKKAVEGVREEVKARSDQYEVAAAAGKYPPGVRARIACQYGLAKEALAVLRAADRQALDLDAVRLWVNLALLAGDAEDARDLLQSPALNPIEQFPAEMQVQLHSLNVQAAAALGDDRAALEHAAGVLAITPRLAEQWAVDAIQDLVLGDVDPGHPLARMATVPAWMSKLITTSQYSQQYGDWLVRQGMLALEQGDPALARQRFAEAAGPAERWTSPAARRLAAIWLDVCDHR